MLAIETSGLAKDYGTTRALIDLDLQVETGQVFGFLGPNGAGKTTTIRMLLALQRPSKGHAAVLGLDPSRESVEVLRRVGYLPGDLALYPHMTARQHIDWFMRARGARRSVLVDDLIERFDVVLDRPAKELSTGNRQKVGLIMALAHRPELLILDEPTSGLDPLMQHEFEALMHEIVAEGRTVFLSSHDLDEVQRIADRVAIIRSGRLVTVDTVDHLRESAPQRIEVRFDHDVDPALFAGVDGVTIRAVNGSTIALEASGRIGPVLRIIADQNPVDVVCRHPDLDELFLGVYRDPPDEGSSRAR